MVTARPDGETADDDDRHVGRPPWMRLDAAQGTERLERARHESPDGRHPGGGEDGRRGGHQPGQHALPRRHAQRRLDPLVTGPGGVMAPEGLADGHQPGQRHPDGEHDLTGHEDPGRRRVRRLLGCRRRQLHRHELLGTGRRRDIGEHGVDLGLQRRDRRPTTVEAQEHGVTHRRRLAVAGEEGRAGEDRALPGPGQPGDAADHQLDVRTVGLAEPGVELGDLVGRQEVERDRVARRQVEVVGVGLDDEDLVRRVGGRHPTGDDDGREQTGRRRRAGRTARCRRCRVPRPGRRPSPPSTTT